MLPGGEFDEDGFGGGEDGVGDADDDDAAAGTLYSFAGTDSACLSATVRGVFLLIFLVGR